MGCARVVRRVALQEVVDDLRAIPESEFTLERLDNYLTGLILDPATLEPYLNFQENAYTRNLVYRDALFEVLVLCWDIGQKTPVHNHRGQLGWMSVQQGMLSILNYKRVDCSAACHLESRWSKVELASDIPIAGIGFVSHVCRKETLHQISNDPAFQQRAVSLHIYSRPFDSCVVYDVAGESCSDKKLSNFTEGGLPTQGGGCAVSLSEVQLCRPPGSFEVEDESEPCEGPKFVR